MFKNIFTEQFFPDYYNNVHTETLEQIFNVDVNLNYQLDSINSKCMNVTETPGIIREEFHTDFYAKELDALSNRSKKTGLKGTNPGIVNFVVELLHSPDTNPSIIKWEDYEEGKFRFTNPERVSKLWGKRNSRFKEKEMDFGKFSRAIRYHYGQGNFVPVPEQKLVYRFGPNAKGWRAVD